MIEIESVKKEIGGATVLDGVTFSVTAGEAFGFLGPNGAGKSTLIDILVGLSSPTAGEIRVFGADATTGREEIRSRVGVVPEDVSPFPSMTGREHVAFVARTMGTDDDPGELLSYTGLDPADHDRLVTEYSTGMRQRMWLATALVGDPELVILDEPMTGLDPNGIRDVREIVDELVADGRTVFFSSHRLSEVEAVCDRVGVLHDGQVNRTVPVDELDGFDTDSEIRLRVETVPSGVRSELTELAGVVDATIGDEWIGVTCREPSAKVDVIDHVADRTAVVDIVSDESSLGELFSRTTAEAH